MKPRTLSLTTYEARRLLKLLQRGMAYTDLHIVSYGRKDARINGDFVDEIANRLGAFKPFHDNTYCFK